jgi:hypothetical protein
MATVTFKGKIETIYNMDDTVAWREIKVPKVTRSHCDMAAFRKHPKFGGLANSDLFPNLLSRQFKIHGISERIRLDRVPGCVSIDESGFLAKVTIDLN